jgi:hypothetical protein
MDPSSDVSGQPNRRAMRGTRLSGPLLNEPVGETTAGMICVSPRRYPVMTGRLQVEQRRPPLAPFQIFIICRRRAGVGADPLGYGKARKWHNQPFGGADGPRSRVSSRGRCTAGKAGKMRIVPP